AQNGDAFLPFAEGGFATASGRCELRLPDYTPPVESRFGSGSLAAKYPLELISPKNDDSMNSTFGNRPDTDQQTSMLALNSAVALCRCLLSVAATGCRRRDKKIRVQQTDEDTATLASVIHMGDPKAESQLLNGFFNIESNTWRWTMGKFTVALRPPRNAGVKGATLHLKFVLPEAVLSKIKTTSISAKVGSVALSPETYTQPGEFDYSREVDPKLLAGEVVH